jgi:hypothetical protein
MCVMARLTGDWQRAGRLIADRRAYLGLTQEQVQERGGPSPASQRLIEAGKRESIQAASAGGYERALHWESGSLRAILTGGDPTPFHEVFDADGAKATDEAAPGLDEFEEGSIRNRVEELIRRRKLRQLDRALSLIEGLDEDAG